MSRILVALGALVMAAGVGLGAFSSHAAKAAIHADAPRLLQIAVLYHLIHGLGILIVGVVARAPSRWFAAAGGLHLAGIVMFCGGLWLLAFTGQSPGFVTPLGGLCFIAGWLAVAGGAIFGSGFPPSRE